MDANDVKNLIAKRVESYDSKETNIEAVLEFIKLANNEDYLAISKAMQTRRELKIRNAKINLKRGDIVVITSSKQLGEFRIDSLKIKNAQVTNIKTNERYRVAMSLLEKVR